GRVFTEESERVETLARVVLLSDGLWRRRFAADPAVVGRTIHLNGLPYTVLGVMPPSFRYPTSEFQLWAPLYFPPSSFQPGDGFNYLSVGRLKPGVALGQAQADFDAISARLAAAPGTETESFRTMLTPLLEDSTG